MTARSPRILLLVKNGIGYGHARRALLISDELRALGADPVVISQAPSLHIFQGQAAKVVNFPLLHRVPSSAAELAYLDLLDRVVEGLRPELVVDDTYPDRRYLQLPSLREVPRVLVMRRVEPIAFDQLRRDGFLAPYERILLAQDEEDFAGEPHSTASRQVVELSGRFRFTGRIHHEPTQNELADVQERYGGQAPLVVVNAGAGGDQIDDAFTDTFFKTAASTAQHCLGREIPAQFVAALGPYYRGEELPHLPNLTCVAWEPRLSALLRIAAVAVLQPGHNVINETLAGSARLVLVPGESWMEGQHELADRMAAADQARVAPVGDAETLTRQVLAALDEGPRDPRPTRRPSGAPRAAQQILTEARRKGLDVPVRMPRPAVCLLVSAAGSLSSPTLAQLLRRVGLADAGVVAPGDRDLDAAGGSPVAGQVGRVSALLPERPNVGINSVSPLPRTLLVDVRPPTTLTPAALAAAGVRLLLDDGPSESGGHLGRWLAYHADSGGILTAGAWLHRADINRPDRLVRRVALLLRERTAAAIHLDLSRLTESAAAASYCEHVARALADGSVQLITPPDYAARLAETQLLAPR